MNAQTENRAEEQARIQCETIARMVNAAEALDWDRLEELREMKADPDLYIMDPDEAEELAELERQAEGFEDAEDAQTQWDEHPLSVEFRSGWSSDRHDLQPEEFRIVLCTGGPHVEVRGEFDRYDEAVNLRVIFKDWGESGELHDFDQDALTRYCNRFLP